MSSELDKLKATWNEHERMVDRMMYALMRCGKCGHMRQCHAKGLMDHDFLEVKQWWVEQPGFEEFRKQLEKGFPRLNE